MAPKAKTAGGSKVGGSRAKTKKVGDTLLLDMRSSGTAQLDDKVKAQKKLEERASEAVLGYARFDVLAHREKIVFGKWNLRPVERTQLQEGLNIKNNGIENQDLRNEEGGKQQGTNKNSRGIGEAQLDDKVQANKKLEDQARKAVIGYARFDVLEHRGQIRFGKWNLRPVQRGQVNGLIQSFLVNGADRFSLKHAIPLVVEKESVKVGTYVVNPDGGDELPVMEIAAGHVGTWGADAAGGQHRVEALEGWVTRLKVESAALKKETAALSEANMETMDDGEIEEHNKVRKPKKDALESYLAYGGQWMVILYDADKVDEAVGLHLAQNKNTHVYRESPEEGLVQMFKRIKVQEEPMNMWQAVKIVPSIKGHPARRQELLSQDYVWRLLELFESAGLHYLTRQGDMKLKQFYSAMMSSYGGILSYMCISMEQRLRYCFNTVEMRMEDVEMAIEMMQEDGSKENEERLLTMYRSLQRATPIPEAIIEAIRQRLDEAFLEHMGPDSTVSQQFGDSKSPEWNKATSQYEHAVEQSIGEAIEESRRAGLFESDKLSPSAITALKTCLPKLKVILSIGSQKITSPNFPLMSRSVYSHMRTMLETISGAILEFSAWMSPFVYMTSAHGNQWTPGSASADMICSILCNTDIVTTKRTQAVDAVVNLIWAKYALFLNMESELASIHVPHRITAQNKLIEAFGLTSTAKKTSTTTGKGKGKGKAKAKGKGKKKDEEYSEEEEYDPEDSDQEDEEDEVIGSGDENEDDDDGVDGETAEERLARRTKKKEDAQLRLKELAEEVGEVIEGLKNTNPPKKPAQHSPTAKFDTPWTRLSRVSSDVTGETFRGHGLLTAHTYEWSLRRGSSFTRVARTLAMITIAESSVVASYRPTLLLYRPKSGAAQLRWSVEEVTELFRVQSGRGGGRMRQTRLDDRTHMTTSDTYVKFTWPDGIYITQRETDKFDLGTELKRLKHNTLFAAQEDQLQRIINMIEGTRLAWQDATGHAHARDRPTIDHTVAQSMKGLIEALNANAYIQRQGTRTRKIDVTRAAQPDEQLHYSVRTIAGEEPAARRTSTSTMILMTKLEQEDLLQALKASNDTSETLKVEKDGDVDMSGGEDDADDVQEDEEDDEVGQVTGGIRSDSIDRELDADAMDVSEPDISEPSAVSSKGKGKAGMPAPAPALPAPTPSLPVAEPSLPAPAPAATSRAPAPFPMGSKDSRPRPKPIVKPRGNPLPPLPEVVPTQPVDVQPDLMEHNKQLEDLVVSMLPKEIARRRAETKETLTRISKDP
ncbi:hypothetical protein BU15DRAFT_82890 [Melanogaster broomeanus]|nr:hypothetical protein BU15DRAFT_82890 [Melanogaster broomeanus]